MLVFLPDFWPPPSCQQFFNNIIIFLSERWHYVTFHPHGLFRYYWSLMFTFFFTFLFNFLFTWKVAGDFKFEIWIEICPPKIKIVTCFLSIRSWHHRHVRRQENIPCVIFISSKVHNAQVTFSTSNRCCHSLLT